MKSFTVALILLLSVILFVGFHTHKTLAYIDEMLSLADTLPQNAADFEKRSQKDDEAILALIDLWDEYFPFIAFTAGYDNTNRCDTAIGEIDIHFQNRNASDFSAALSEFCDSLARLRILEGFHLEGIF